MTPAIQQAACAMAERGAPPCRPRAGRRRIMLYAGLITLREGVEASLIIAIVLSYLSRIGQQRGHRVVLGGASLALFLSVASAAGLQLLTLDLPKAAQEATEGLTMLFAVAVLTWMLVWMRRQAVSLGGHLRAQVD